MSDIYFNRFTSRKIIEKKHAKYLIVFDDVINIIKSKSSDPVRAIGLYTLIYQNTDEINDTALVKYAEMLKIGNRTLKKILDELEDLKLIVKYKSKHSRKYLYKLIVDDDILTSSKSSADNIEMSNDIEKMPNDNKEMSNNISTAPKSTIQSGKVVPPKKSNDSKKYAYNNNNNKKHYKNPHEKKKDVVVDFHVFLGEAELIVDEAYIDKYIRWNNTGGGKRKITNPNGFKKAIAKGSFKLDVTDYKNYVLTEKRIQQQEEAFKKDCKRAKKESDQRHQRMKQLKDYLKHLKSTDPKQYQTLWHEAEVLAEKRYKEMLDICTSSEQRKQRLELYILTFTIRELINTEVIFA